jgi:hypothetical protein
VLSSTRGAITYSVPGSAFPPPPSSSSPSPSVDSYGTSLHPYRSSPPPALLATLRQKEEQTTHDDQLCESDTIDTVVFHADDTQVAEETDRQK